MQKSAKHKCSNAVSETPCQTSHSKLSIAALHIQQATEVRDQMREEAEALQQEKEELQQKWRCYIEHSHPSKRIGSRVFAMELAE